MSDLAGLCRNHEDRFSCVAAHIVITSVLLYQVLPCHSSLDTVNLLETQKEIELKHLQ